MSKFKSFEEILSWQKSRVLNKKIYLITENSNFKKDFDLVRQIRRASISISSNIAEGFERNTDKEFIYFLNVAKASAGEVRSQLYLAFDLKYITEQEYNQLLESVTEISKWVYKIFESKVKSLSTFDFRLSI